MLFSFLDQHFHVITWPPLDTERDAKTEAAYDDLCLTVQIARSVGIPTAQRDEIAATADLLTAAGIRAYEFALRQEIYRRQSLPVVKAQPPAPNPVAKPALVGFDVVSPL